MHKLVIISMGFAAAALVACGGDDSNNNNSGKDSGTDSGGGMDSGGMDAGNKDSGGGDSGGGDSGGGDSGGAPDCNAYCSEVMTNCTAANAQYASMQSCLGVCAAFPVGKLGDMMGNTLGCREYHGGAPAMSTPATHCTHAGITGGDENVGDTTPGVCGEGCDSFCTVAQAVCTGGNQQWADKAACMTDCKQFPNVQNPPYSTADTGTDDFGCRAYHLSVAATDAASAMTHCPHIVLMSPVCTM